MPVRAVPLVCNSLSSRLSIHAPPFEKNRIPHKNIPGLIRNATAPSASCTWSSNCTCLLAGFTAPRSSVLLGSGCYGRVSQTERLRNNTHVFRAVLGAGRQGASTVKFPRGPSSGSWTADLAFFTCHRESERTLWGPFYKSTNPICGGSLLMT